MTQARFRAVAWAALGFTLAVILWGAFVRATGSGAGCGSHWPTCNGEVLPRPKSLATIIEFTHRATSGIALLLTIGQLVWAMVAFPKRHPVRWGAAASMFFMVTEALVGAGLVLFELVAKNTSIARAWWMSAHLINTFLLIAAMTVTVFWASGGAPPSRKADSTSALVLALGLLGTVTVGVTGAIAALGDTLFPAKSLAQGLAEDIAPTAHLLVQLRVMHPVVAAVVAAYLMFVTGFLSTRRPSLGRRAKELGALVGLQIGAGLLNLALLAPVWLQLVHLLLADLVWISLVVLTATALRDPAKEPTGAPPEAGAAVSHGA